MTLAWPTEELRRLDSRRSDTFRAISTLLGERAAPNVAARHVAREVTVASLLLRRMAAEEDLLPGIFTGFEERFAAAISEGAALLARYGDTALSAEALDVAAESGAVSRLALELSLLTRICENLANLENRGDELPDVEKTLKQTHLLLGEWRLAVEAGVTADQQQSAGRPRLAPTKTDVGALVTAETMTAYLRRAFPALPQIEASSVTIMTEGSQKWTVCIALSGQGDLPAQMIMRQDSGSNVVDETVIDEVPVFGGLASRGLPVPALYHVEPRVTELGGAFLLVSLMQGQPAGSFFGGFAGVSPIVGEDLARALGKLHQVDPRTLNIRPSEPSRSPQEWLLAKAERSWEVWRAAAPAPSPLIESAFAWLRRECRRGVGPASIVHGDVKPDNILVGSDGRMSALLDWEFIHVGDAAEDLGYCRHFVEDLMPWRDFMRIYYEAGGPPTDNRRMRIGELWGHLRNASWSANSEQECREGRADDFVQRAHGFITIPFIESLIARCMRDAEHDS